MVQPCQSIIVSGWILGSQLCKCWILGIWGFWTSPSSIFWRFVLPILGTLTKPHHHPGGTGEPCDHAGRQWGQLSGSIRGGYPQLAGWFMSWKIPTWEGWLWGTPILQDHMNVYMNDTITMDLKNGSIVLWYMIQHHTTSSLDSWIAWYKITIIRDCMDYVSR